MSPDGPQVVGVMPFALGVFPGAALDLDFNGQIVVRCAEFGTGHDAVFVGVGMRIGSRGCENGFDDRKIFFVGADLLRFLDSPCEPKGSGFFGVFVGGCGFVHGFCSLFFFDFLGSVGLYVRLKFQVLVVGVSVRVG